jgi:hypothetical protein
MYIGAKLAKHLGLRREVFILVKGAATELVGLAQ